MVRRAALLLGAAAVALVLAVGASAAEAFDAHGSVEQVYVTGVSPGARMTLVDGAGGAVVVVVVGGGGAPTRCQSGT